MSDDLTARLRRQFDDMPFDDVTTEAADEIDRLRRMAMTLIDELRQNGGYEAYTPEMLFQEFYDVVSGVLREARRD